MHRKILKSIVNLLLCITGYVAYFVDLMPSLQVGFIGKEGIAFELIRRK